MKLAVLNQAGAWSIVVLVLIVILAILNLFLTLAVWSKLHLWIDHGVSLSRPHSVKSHATLGETLTRVR